MVDLKYSDLFGREHYLSLPSSKLNQKEISLYMILNLNKRRREIN